VTEKLLDRLETLLDAALAFNENADVPPVALLWPDREGQFDEASVRLRRRRPLLTLGQLDREVGQGPAYWLRCVIARTIDLELPRGIPIIYLPGFGREDLRAIEDCPRELAPLAELQYRGQWFSHPNGKDWTPRSLLVNRERGLGLDVAEDPKTLQALVGALSELLDLPMVRLEGRYIDADFLHGLLNPDQVGALLEWLDDAAGFRERMDSARWNAFVERSKSDFNFDPAAEGEITGARRLGERQGAWEQVWRRYARDPALYPDVERRLREGKPLQLFVGQPGSWPQDNEEEESALRTALRVVADSPLSEARERIEKLWGEHRERRNWVWARLDRSPLVFALEQLQRLADSTRGGPAGDVAGLAAAYAASGWQADDAFLAALRAAGNPADREAVAGAAKAFYAPWLEANARALQKAVSAGDGGGYTAGPPASTEKRTATVFVDGLRLDLAHRVAGLLEGLDVRIETSLAALPTITDTAKPALAPVTPGALIAGTDLGPVRATSGAKANATVLRRLMAEGGLQILQGAETGDPTGSAWVESGDIDGRGHHFQGALVDEIEGELNRIARRVNALLQAGWAQVEIVTDHGWLLLPGGLPKVDLPAATVELKKGRCARLKPGASVTVPTLLWHWDRDVRIAVAPGASCFDANQEYEHGGVSLQECVVPRLRIRAAAAATSTAGATITKLKWLGLMCRVEYENVPAGAVVDIRARPGEPKTSMAAEARETSGAGKAALFVDDEEQQGEVAFVVIVGREGSILAQRETRIGENR
jgi:hypothetical protein